MVASTTGLATLDRESTDVARERTGLRWANRAGTASSLPSRIEQPASVGDALAAVRTAVRNGEPLHAVGAGFAASGLAAAPGTLIDTSRLTGLVAVDQVRGTATFLAGTTVSDAAAELKKFGAAMVGAPTGERATLGGAVSTGAHGFAPREASFSAQVRGVTLVTAEGRLLRVSASENAEYWPVARLGLGSLGVIVEVTVGVRRDRSLELRTKRRNIDDILHDIPEAHAKVDYYRVEWSPRSEKALLTVGWYGEPRAVAQPVAPRELEQKPRRRDTIKAKLSKFLPFLTPAINKVASAFDRSDAGERAGKSHDTEGAGVQIEYQFPVARARLVIAALRELEGENRHLSGAAVQLSLVAADEVWLSPAYGRDVVAISVTIPGTYGRKTERALRILEDLFISLGGLPNWGGWHTLTGPEAAYVMPRYSDFTHVQPSLDPHRRTDNPSLRRLLRH